MGAYSFGSSYEFGVEIPELDAFVAEIDAVCQRHGVSFKIDHGWSDDCAARIVLAPYESVADDLLRNLEEAERGVPWLDAARDEVRRRQTAHYEAERAAKARGNAEAAEKRRQAAEAALLQNGVTLSDGKTYKLVPNE
jgi:hypothetical protein